MIQKYILDPLSVIVKLAILSKKPIGTKIAIWSNTIYIQEVGMFQSLVRIIYQNNKNDLQYLYNPIELGCKNYLTPYYIKKYPDIKNLFSNAIKGLEKLKTTYSHNIMITHTLNLYLSIIQNYLGNNFNPNLFIKDNISPEYNLTDLENIFLNIWVPCWKQIQTYTNLNENTNREEIKNEDRKEERIKAILNLIDFIDKDTQSDSSVKCLEEFMVIIDNEVKTKIDKINLDEETNLLDKKNINYNTNQNLTTVPVQSLIPIQPTALVQQTQNKISTKDNSKDTKK